MEDIKTLRKNYLLKIYEALDNKEIKFYVDNDLFENIYFDERYIMISIIEKVLGNDGEIFFKDYKVGFILNIERDD